MLTKINHAKKARELFLSGYNCTQAVFCAFTDVTGLDEKTAMRMSAAFGGGMGRLREVCGTVSGMNMVISWVFGYDTPGDNQAKALLYSYVQRCAYKFSDKYGSIVCRELLGLEKGENNGFVPTERTAEFYKKRPCAEYVENAAAIVEEFLEHKMPKE